MYHITSPAFPGGMAASRCGFAPVPPKDLPQVICRAERGSWDAVALAALSDWQSACRDALNDFRVEAMNGPGHDVYDCELT
jgi:hypothetical protein